MTEPVKIGYVKYLNTLPLVAGLEAFDQIAMRPAPPAMLASMLRAGEVDLALASIVDLAGATTGGGAGGRGGVVQAPTAGSELTLVPVGMIGCDGPTLTVRLYSRTPFDRVTRLACDVESHTSVILARVILARSFSASPSLELFDGPHAAAGAGAWPDALLLIGDKVVSGAPPEGTYAYELDLGLAWKELTGLPFVYAMWMARAADVEADSPRCAALRSVAILLDRQRRRNAMRLDWIVDRSALERGWPRDLARRYVTEYLRYEPTDASLSAVQRFFDEAAALGFLPKTNATAWSIEHPVA